MKKILLAVAVACASVMQASAFDLKGLLGNSGLGDAVGNLIEGVFTTGNIEVKDLAGVWTVSGSAVSFQSENFLMKAGGVAGAAAVESKLNPYFKKYGLTGGVFTIQKDGTFEFKMKRITLSGVITKLEDGNFEFSFQALGAFNIGSMKTYVEKGPSNLNIMFDASKLKQIMSVAAAVSGSKLAKAGTDILTKYDGICVGFKMDKSGSVEGEDNAGQSPAGGLLNILRNSEKKK